MRTSHKTHKAMELPEPAIDSVPFVANALLPSDFYT